MFFIISLLWNDAMSYLRWLGEDFPSERSGLYLRGKYVIHFEESHVQVSFTYFVLARTLSFCQQLQFINDAIIHAKHYKIINIQVRLSKPIQLHTRSIFRTCLPTKYAKTIFLLPTRNSNLRLARRWSDKINFMTKIIMQRYHRISHKFPSLKLEFLTAITTKKDVVERYALWLL